MIFLWMISTSVVWLLWNNAVDSNINHESFVRFNLSSGFCGPKCANETWQVKSSLGCAVRCKNSYPDCYSFIYNKENKLCTPCVGLTSDTKMNPVLGGDVYYSDSCQAYPDFSHHENNENNSTRTRSYAAYFEEPKSYRDAQEICRCLKAQLFVARSMERFNLFASIGDIDSSNWIGLNDMAVKGRYVWVDDEQEINSSLKSELFDSDPDIDENNRCVYKDPFRTRGEHSLLRPGQCNLNLSYICEKPECRV